jgi:hypothetical protein
MRWISHLSLILTCISLVRQWCYVVSLTLITKKYDVAQSGYYVTLDDIHIMLSVNFQA